MGWSGRDADTLPRMDWYPQDYLSDPKTRGMNLEQHGAYFLLLQLEWIGGPLPISEDKLAAMLGVNKKTFARIWPVVGECFVPTEDGFSLVNPRLERERAAMLEHRDSARVASKVANEKRWGSPSKDPNRIRIGSETAPPSPSPSPSHTHPTLSPGSDRSDSGQHGVCVASPGTDPPTAAPLTAQPLQDASEPDDTSDAGDAALHAAWNAARAAKTPPLRPQPLTGEHAAAYAELRHATAEDAPLAIAVIRAFHDDPDPYLERSGWSVKVFPFRIDGLLGDAAKRVRRATAERRTADPEPVVDAVDSEEAAARARDIVASLRKSAAAP